MRSIIIAISFSLITLTGLSQVTTSDFEAGNKVYYAGLGWDIGTNTAANTTIVSGGFNGTSVAQTTDLGQKSPAEVQSPWINLIQGATLGYTHAVPAYNGTRTLDVYAVSYKSNTATLLKSYTYTNSTPVTESFTFSLPSGPYRLQWIWKGTGGNSKGEMDNIVINGANISDPVSGLPVVPAPVSTFTGTPVSGTYPLTVSFTDQTTNVPTSWSWNFGEGSPSSLQNPTHTYNNAGDYTVTLTTSNQGGQNTLNKRAYIHVIIPAPVVAFSVGTLSGIAPLAVNFNDQSTNNPTSWSWNFGDGSTSTVKSAQHTYSSPGTYTVSLTATNATGSNTLTKTNYITVTIAAPVAAFTGTPLSGNAPLAVTFTDQSTNSPTSWSWNFGDGTTSTVQNPTHTYASSGNFTVSLTATNATGFNTSTKSNFITVTIPAPVAAFTGTPLSGATPLAVTFTDQSTNSPTSWTWNFGDGSNNSAQNPTHTYASSGTYTVSLTVKNATGSNTVTKTNYITVGILAPVAAFTGTPLSGNAPLAVTFTDQSTNSPTLWFWNFGDGTTSTLQNPQHTYANPGTYTVSLTATNATGKNTLTSTGYVFVTGADTDGDGVPDSQDDFPKDPTRAYNNYYPATGSSTLAFEDNWPTYGDYDMNDLVIGYNFQIVTNAQNNVVELFGTFNVRAAGANLKNGFGFQLPGVAPNSIISVAGAGSQKGYTVAPNGTEQGNTSTATFIVYDDQTNFMSVWNTVKGDPASSPKSFTLDIKFADNGVPAAGGWVNSSQFIISGWNPFIARTGFRGHEIHLPDHASTMMADSKLFGTKDDDSNPATSKYYKSKTNLPWALDFYGEFKYPVERADVSNSFLRFKDWLTSGGTTYKDWWSNTTAGYRNNAAIY